MLINLIATAAEQGATLLNYAKVTSLHKGGDGILDGVSWENVETGEKFTARAKVVVNATGTAGITASPIPLAFCGCPHAAGIVSQASNCTTVCSDGTAPGHYVTVSAALSHQTIMSFLNLPLPATLTASSTVRIQ